MRKCYDLIGDNMEEKKLNIEEMEELGIADYYLDLIRFINGFVDRNYPMTPEDMRAMVNDNTTSNLTERKEVMDVMKKDLNEILKHQAMLNVQFLNDLKEGKPVKAITIEDYNNQIFNYIQHILGALNDYKKQKEGSNKSK